MSRWVFKHDGTIQCQAVVGQTLDEAREELALVVSADNIVGGEARSILVITPCGAPTGHVNAFELNDAGIELFDNGINPHIEWHYWLFNQTPPLASLAASHGPEVPFPQLSLDYILCRDCPFPSSAGIDDPDWRRAVEARLKDFQAQMAILPTADLNWLTGYTLRVLSPDSSNPTLDLRPHRLNITVDANEIITHTTIG